MSFDSAVGFNASGFFVSMILIKKDYSDLSNEGYLALAVLLEMMYAATIMAYQYSDALERLGAKGSLVQRKKQHFNRAKQLCNGLVSELENAFGDTFDNVFKMVSGKEAERTDQVAYIANDIIKILLIYFSRGDGDPEKRTRMQKALLNFKALDDIDTDGLLEFFKFRM